MILYVKANKTYQIKFHMNVIKETLDCAEFKLFDIKNVVCSMSQVRDLCHHCLFS